MAIENEELMQKFVRIGMIMRHIDGEVGHGHGRKCCHHHGHGHGHGGHHHEVEAARFEAGAKAEHGHGHGLEGRPEEGAERCGHGHGHGKHRRGQARVLSMVAMQEGINQKDLAFLLGIRPQTLGEMLRKLEERGLVERKKSEADARAIEVTLTDEGRSRAAEIAEQRKLVAADIFAALSDEDKEQLMAILGKLDDELEKRRPKSHCKHAGKGKGGNEAEGE